MSEEEQYDQVLQEIKGIFQFLTEGEPSPDDEIEAREKLLGLFSELERVNINGKNKELIGSIISQLNQWDTLDLWFLETSIPNDMRELFGLDSEDVSSQLEDKLESFSADATQDINSLNVDLDQIIDKVSEQFKGEIDELKTTIETLKDELDKKEEAIKTISKSSKRVQKIVPKNDVKLPPPVIKIPVIKKPTPPQQIKPSVKRPKVPPKKTGMDADPQIKSGKPSMGQPKSDLTPIPLKPVAIKPELEIPKAPPKTEIGNIQEDLSEKPDLIPIPFEEEIPLEEIKLPEDKPLATEKIKLTPIVTERDEDSYSTISEEYSQAEDEDVVTMEKPKITSVMIEEVETETIKSTGKDLFSVFSSVGEKPQEKTEKPKPSDELQLDFDKKNKNEKKKKKSDVVAPTPPRAFIGFESPQPKVKPDASFSLSDIEDLPNDKDSLYQELIALEGRRYSLEKNFKELEKNYNKGSIADLQYKNQSDGLKKKLNDITSRINKIRRIISSL